MAVSTNSSLTVVSTSASANTAKIKYVVTCTVSGDSYNNNTQKGSFAIDGVTYESSYSLPKNTTTTVFEKEVEVGNASGRTIHASYSFPTTPAGGTKSGNNSVQVPVLVQAPTINSFNLTERGSEHLSFSYSLGSNANLIYYRLNMSENWVQVGNNVSSGYFVIGNLAPNTVYTVDLIARNVAGSEIMDTTRRLQESTHDIARITNVNDFVFGDAVRLIKTNPSGNFNRIRVELLDSTETYLSIDNAGNDINIVFPDDTLDRIYKKLGNSMSIGVRFVVDMVTGNNNTYYHWKDVTCYFKGNHKTAHIGSGNKRAKIFIGVNGGVKRAVAWIGNNGRKRCI